MPRSNVAFWKAKFEANRERDARNIAALQKAGWRVEIVWECEVRDGEQLARRFRKLAACT